MGISTEQLIHPTAIVDPNAHLAEAVEIGAYSIVEGDVVINEKCRIDTHVLVGSGTRLGSSCHLFKGAVVGSIPQDLKFKGEKSELLIGDRTVIREFCTLNRGTEHGGLTTAVGSDSLLMAYVHVAHDCRIGNRVILANAVNMAGHVVIQDFASIGGMSVIHQFVKIGRYAFIGGWSRVSKDVPPYALMTGEDMRYYGPNVIGLRRHGFSSEQINSIKRAYQYIYRSKLNLTQAISAVKSELEITDEVGIILDFISDTKRGLAGL